MKRFVNERENTIDISIEKDKDKKIWQCYVCPLLITPLCDFVKTHRYFNIVREMRKQRFLFKCPNSMN